MSGVAMVSWVLFAGVALVIGVQMPELRRSTMHVGWESYALLACVCFFLVALGLATRRAKQTGSAALAAVLVSTGYAVLLSPVPFVGPSEELLFIVFGAGALLVLAGRAGRDIGLRSKVRGGLLWASGLFGALVLLHAGGRRYMLQFQTLSPSIADAIWWAWYISIVLCIASVLALMSAIRKGITEA